MQFNKLSIAWAQAYTEQFKESPYNKVKIGDRVDNYFTAHYIKWVFNKFQETFERDFNFTASLIAWADILEVDMDDYKGKKDPEKKERDVSKVELPEFLKNK